jgi:hypothetical protein
MQASLEGRRTTQLWHQTNTGTRSLGANDSRQGVPDLFPDSPTSFESNAGSVQQTRHAQPTGTAMPGMRAWLRPA